MIMETDNRKKTYDFLGTALLKSEKEIYEFLSNNLSDTIYTLHINNNFMSKYNHLFFDPKFLSVFNQALITYKSQNRLGVYDVIYVNISLYWYIVTQSTDEYIKMLWYMIADTINREEVEKLNSLKIFDIELCNFLVIANKSSLVENTRIKNTIFTIYTSSLKPLTTEEFISIYNVLYPKHFKGLLLTVLFDQTIDNVFNGKENTERGILAITNRNTSVYAVLVMLERMNAYDIIRLLKFVYYNYSNEYNYDSEVLKVSFKNLSKDLFPRICLAAENMINEDMILP